MTGLFSRLTISASTLLLLVTLPLDEAQGQSPSEMRQLEAEIIIFRRSGDRGADEESWTQNPGYPDGLEQALEIGSSSARDVGIRTTSPARLAHVVQSLNSSNDYQVLRHERLRLPERSSSEAPGIRFHLDQRPDDEGRESGQPTRSDRFQDAHLAQEEDAVEAMQDSSDTVDTGPDLARPLDGTITIFRDRFFHVAADLIFNPDLDASDPDAGRAAARQRHSHLRDLIQGGDGWQQLQQRDELSPFLGYRLNERRRIRRLGEIHYLDHPRFGVIVLLSRPD